MGIQSTIALISINATLLVQLGSFLIFLFIINRIMFKPLNAIKKARMAHMEEIQRDIRNAETQIREMLATLEEEERKTRDEALQRRRDLEEDARIQAKRKFDEVNAEIEILKDRTNLQVREQVENVRRHLAEEAQRLARVIMEKTLERRVTDETV